MNDEVLCASAFTAHHDRSSIADSCEGRVSGDKIRSFSVQLLRKLVEFDLQNVAERVMREEAITSGGRKKQRMRLNARRASETASTADGSQAGSDDLENMDLDEDVDMEDLPDDAAMDDDDEDDDDFDLEDGLADDLEGASKSESSKVAKTFQESRSRDPKGKVAKSTVRKSAASEKKPKNLAQHTIKRIARELDGQPRKNQWSDAEREALCKLMHEKFAEGTSALKAYRAYGERSKELTGVSRGAAAAKAEWQQDEFAVEAVRGEGGEEA